MLPLRSLCVLLNQRKHTFHIVDNGQIMYMNEPFINYPKSVASMRDGNINEPS